MREKKRKRDRVRNRQRERWRERREWEREIWKTCTPEGIISTSFPSCYYASIFTSELYFLPVPPEYTLPLSLLSLSWLSGSLGVYHGRLSLTQIYLTSVESSMCLMGWGLPVYRQPYEDATMPDSGESCPEGAWHDACNHGSPPVSLSLLSRGAESKMGKEETERESLKSSPSPLSSWQSWKGSFGRSEMAFNNCSFTDLPRSVSMTQK